MKHLETQDEMELEKLDKGEICVVIPSKYFSSDNDYYVKYWRNEWKTIIKPIIDL